MCGTHCLCPRALVLGWSRPSHCSLWRRVCLRGLSSHILYSQQGGGFLWNIFISSGKWKSQIMGNIKTFFLKKNIYFQLLSLGLIIFLMVNKSSSKVIKKIISIKEGGVSQSSLTYSLAIPLVSAVLLQARLVLTGGEYDPFLSETRWGYKMSWGGIFEMSVSKIKSMFQGKYFLVLMNYFTF